MANIEFEPHDSEKHLVVCTGDFGCGATILGEMEYEHLQFHQGLGHPVELPTSGANDPGPMPEREQ